MATLRKSPHSPYWHAVFRTGDKRQTNRSTKVPAKVELRDRALERARLMEQEQRSKDLLSP